MFGPLSPSESLMAHRIHDISTHAIPHYHQQMVLQAIKWPHAILVLAHTGER